ncbi:phosphatidate cytidylyltransferase [Wenxinia saemankumensis]|uniref:Phosphatidate cytidylyltransferase n=1 Tax=Wenxinia saemankumensis TaxID=1447782 RepID=A0A1M6A1C5_9RHOB|nr:phosphatidate cytidylyltransferase [Wenxinia saemankumensis]SHI29973.1 phosphatidate cytidylyltransferase [Wenxinia saemankumensis]
MTGQPATPPGAGDRWADLAPRLISGAVIAVIGLVAIILGGPWFTMLAVFACAVMVWELWMMIEPGRPTSGSIFAALVASVLSGMLTFTSPWAAVLFLVAPIVGWATLRRERRTWLAFALGIQIAGWGLVMFRHEYGFTWLVWMVLIIIAADVAGYFVGKSLGGPKFWPRVSPKKTWSGTIGGWVAAALVGAVFDLLFVRTSWEIIPLSVALAFAGQMGDVAESALKRRMGVKDSSTLIPGHGGLFDRFDALLGASLFLLLVVGLFDLPGVGF